MSRSIVGQTQSLGWELMQQEYTKGLSRGGLALSPLSVIIALGMLAGAAQKDDQKALALKLGVEDPAELSRALVKLFQDQISPFRGKTIEIANAVFTDYTTSLHPQYAQYLQAFDAEGISYPSLADSVDEINGWISDHTGGLILDLLSRALLAPSHITLINTLAFKGKWKHRFDPRNTVKDYQFRKSSSERRKVDMMFQRRQKYSIAHHKHYTAILLPYEEASAGGPAMSLIAYLPNEDTDVVRILPEIHKPSKALSWNMTMVATLALPKVEIDTKLSLLDRLSQLGFPLGPSFPQMTTEGDNVISSIVHGAVVKMDEEGTVAVAATAIMMKRSISLNPELELIFDRPFAFAIVVGTANITAFTGIFDRP